MREDDNATRAAELRFLAEGTAAATLSLYVEGEGYFACGYPNGSRVEVRHALDFLTVGATMAADLPDSVKREMKAFFGSELRTPGFMRALSLSDAAATASDRADHGPRGAWDGWPGLSATALGALGAHDAALALVRDLAGVLREGPFGQAHHERASVTIACEPV